jgi:hypothetical protein
MLLLHCRFLGRSVVLLAGGERSCRTCLDPQVSFPGSCLQPQQLQGAAWLFVSGYAAYQDGLLLQAVRLAKQVRCCVCCVYHVPVLQLVNIQYSAASEC